MKRAGLSLAALALLSGCASSIHTTELASSAPAGTPVNGVPFRVRDQFTVELYRKTPKGYERVAQQTATLADPTRLYVLHFQNLPLSSASVEVDVQPDSTLKVVDLTTTGNASTDAAAIGKAGQDAAKALADLRAAQEKAATGQTADTETHAAGAANAVIDLETAVANARTAQGQLDELPPSTLTSDRLKKEGEVRVLKLKANEAARKAGVLVKPFPEV